MASCRSMSCGASDGICFVCKFSEILSLLTLPISVLCYWTVFSVLLWMWQSVCSSYCRQLNAVSFSTSTSCCTVQIHIQSADLVVLRYIAGIFAHILNIPDSDYKLRHIWRSVRPSVRPSARNNSTPTACIFMNFDIWVIFEICREYSNFIKIWQACPVLHMNTGVHLWLYLIHLFLELEFFQTKFV